VLFYCESWLNKIPEQANKPSHSENHSAQPILAALAGGYPDIPDSEMKIPEHPAMCHKLYTLCSVVASLNKPHLACETPKINAFFILLKIDRISPDLLNATGC
jgi:hypothetical protein